jgi:hypothetical protein
LLYQPHSSRSLTRCSNIWTRYVFNIPCIADWKEIGENWQQLIDLNDARENAGRIDYDYQVGQKVLIWNNSILHKAESRYQKGPWTIMSVHTNGIIRVQCGKNLKDEYPESKTV